MFANKHSTQTTAVVGFNVFSHKPQYWTKWSRVLMMGRSEQRGTWMCDLNSNSYFLISLRIMNVKLIEVFEDKAHQSPLEITSVCTKLADPCDGCRDIWAMKQLSDRLTFPRRQHSYNTHTRTLKVCVRPYADTLPQTQLCSWGSSLKWSDDWTEQSTTTVLLFQALTRGEGVEVWACVSACQFTVCVWKGECDSTDWQSVPGSTSVMSHRVWVVVIATGEIWTF